MPHRSRNFRFWLEKKWIFFEICQIGYKFRKNQKEILMKTKFFFHFYSLDLFTLERLFEENYLKIKFFSFFLKTQIMNFKLKEKKIKNLKNGFFDQKIKYFFLF